MLRVVLDLNVMLRGLLNPHSPCGALLRDYSDRYHAIFSAEALVLLKAFLNHPTLVQVFPRLEHIRRRRLNGLLLCAECVTLAQDHGLDVFVATACAAHADYLIAETPGILSDCQAQGIPTLSTRDFLALLDSPPPLPPAVKLARPPDPGPAAHRPPTTANRQPRTDN